VSDPLNDAAWQLLDVALVWRRVDRDRKPEVTVPGDGAATACLSFDTVSVPRRRLTGSADRGGRRGSAAALRRLPSHELHDVGLVGG
jgi:hypothetical protein